MKIQWKINENFNEISINKELCKSHDKRAISKFQIQQISFKFIQLPFKHFAFGESERDLTTLCAMIEIQCTEGCNSRWRSSAISKIE